VERVYTVTGFKDASKPLRLQTVSKAHRPSHRNCII